MCLDYTVVYNYKTYHLNSGNWGFIESVETVLLFGQYIVVSFDKLI